MPFSLEISAGRLVEARMSAPEPEEMAHFRTRMHATLVQLPGRGVIIADLTGVAVFAPDVAARMLEMLKTDNPKVERTAFVLSRRRTSFADQARDLVDAAERAARATGKKVERRIFVDRNEARAWLAEVLTPAEIVRLDQFVKTIPTT